MADEKYLLRNVYGQIILGYSPTKINGSRAYIRHFSPLEQGELDGGYSSFLDKALSRGLIAEEQRLKDLAAEGTWTDADEAFIENQRVYIQGMVTTKKNLPLPSQVEAQNEQIKVAEKALYDKLSLRAATIGLTAEGFAKKKINEMYILSSLFRDKELTIPFYSDEDFDDLDLMELDRVAGFFNDTMSNINDKVIKKIAIEPFFQNGFALCEDNIYHFYGRPIVSLTFFQSDLASYARFFKHILSSEPKPPADVITDPDKIIDWHNANKNAEKMLKANNAGNVAVVGATPQDMEALSGDVEKPSFEKLAKGKNKMRGAEFMKMLK